MRKITGRYHKNPLKTARGVAETRLTIEKLPKGHNSSKHQLSMTSVKYDQVIKISFIKLKNVGGIAETRTSVDKMFH